MSWADREGVLLGGAVYTTSALSSPRASLKAAAAIADCKAPEPVMDWAGAVERLKQQKMEHGRAVKPITWNHSYALVLNEAVAALTSKRAPTSPADLGDQMIRRWATGSRMRRKQGDPVEDQQIINLLPSLPGDAAGQRWSEALKLLAERGLRPIELVPGRRQPRLLRLVRGVLDAWGLWSGCLASQHDPARLRSATAVLEHLIGRVAVVMGMHAEQAGRMVGGKLEGIGGGPSELDGQEHVVA